MKKLFRVGPETQGVNNSSKQAVVFAWQGQGNFLASVASNGVVRVLDRHGELVPDGEVVLKGQGEVLALAWDASGEILAVLQEGNGIIELWDLKSRRATGLDTNLKDPSFIKWASAGPELAVGTAKGNLLLYNSDTRRKVPVLGKHPRRITCGAWSNGGRLAMGSEDRTLTISDREGSTIDQRDLKSAALEMSFAMAKGTSGRLAEETHLSVNLGKSLLLYDLKDSDNPLELAFQSKYGSIVTHCWFDDGHIMLGFSEGFLVVISTHTDEIGEELHSGRFHRTALTAVAYSPKLKLAAVAGDGGLKIVDCSKGFDEVSEPEDVPLPRPNGRGFDKCTSVGWSPDGAILTVACASGTTHAFLARMHICHASYQTSLAYLSNLKEVSVLDVRTRLPPLHVPVSLEPSLVALGAMHLAVASSSGAVAFHRCLPEDHDRVGPEHEYGKVKALVLNDKYAAVLASDGTLTLHEIEPGLSVASPGPNPNQHANSHSQRRKVFPEGGESPGRGGRSKFSSANAITAVALTPHFLIYGTASGAVETFFLEQWTSLAGATMRHSCFVNMVVPNPAGTRVVVVDEKGEAFMGNAVTADLTPFPHFPKAVKAVLWDTEVANVVYAWDGKDMHTYVYAPSTVKGPSVAKLGPVSIGQSGQITVEPEALPLPSGCTPILCHGGEVTCQDSLGNLSVVTAPHFNGPDDERAAALFKFTHALSFCLLKKAWDAALALNAKPLWYALSYKAMELMDVGLAIRVYRQLGDAGMVMGLEQLRGVEDRKLLAGHIALLYDDYQGAQDLFLASGRPLAALEMRRDLLHWDQALKLAQTLAPGEVPQVSVQYARQLEFKGDYPAALKMFEQALGALQQQQQATQAEAMRGARPRQGEGKSGSEDKEASASETLQATALSGIARCTLRLGDLRRGLRYVTEAKDPSLCRECARILEGMQTVADTEAASLYELGGQFDRAVAIYIKSAKNLPAAKAIIDKVTAPKLLCEYAARCEKEGQYEEAAAAYTRGRDLDAVVRLCLERLNSPEKAFEIVRATASSSGAQLVAHYCKHDGNYRGAIEFLLLARCSDDAFELAKAHECMDVYTKTLGDGIGSSEAASVAAYFESLQQLGEAGHFYSLCGQYARALRLFLQCGENEVERAIEVVGKARNDALTHTLIDFLMGETDGVAKEPRHIYRLYMALGNFTQAASTAAIIARQEQELGNYKQAHVVLFETIKQLEDHEVRVPSFLRRTFTLLHSYMLVKKLVKRSDHDGAARMLLRIAESISKFPSHKVPILTSTVIECTRGGLKASGLEYAMVLMRPEYRSQVDAKYKRKIEALVRKPKEPGSREDGNPVPLSPCPISGELIPTTSLECPTTKDPLPMCVVTGQHITSTDLCLCPRSGMPALYSHYVRYIETEVKAAAEAGAEEVVALDPVTESPVRAEELVRLSAEEAAAYIAKHNMDKEEAPPSAKGPASPSSRS